MGRAREAQGGESVRRWPASLTREGARWKGVKRCEEGRRVQGGEI
jgi:hypothetical protein